ncbi:MAG TPA: helix-turn-helix domain-containing protein, partial [Blastocatellia bacterium]|nr:helix-turn-helix domain-containing protein [Blastocatellia bacterium]
GSPPLSLIWNPPAPCSGPGNVGAGLKVVQTGDKAAESLCLLSEARRFSTPGACKALIGDPDSSRGKRGSYRYIYAYFPGYHHIILLYLFAKNDTADLPGPNEKATGSASEPDQGSDEMSRRTERRAASARKSVKRSERMVTDKESSELLQSASQALAMVGGSKLAGGRISVRQAPPEPRPRSKGDIIRLRQRLNFSQGMLARALNVSPSTVQAWEAGRRTPSDAALKLLAIAEKHPEALLDSV